MTTSRNENILDDKVELNIVDVGRMHLDNLGEVAHEFNNLLTAINGYTYLALQRAGADDRIRIYLEEIQKAGERATNLAQQLLVLSHRQSTIDGG